MTEQPVRPSPEEVARWLRCHRFFDHGFSYYVCGRFAMVNFLFPVAAINLHHAIEMFLKGYLIRRHGFDDDTLRKRFGHHLDALWVEFRTRQQEPIYERFTQTIAELNKFEELRYPPPEPTGTGHRQAQAYYPTRPTKPHDPRIQHHLVRDEIDYLVIVLYQLSGMPPQGGLLRETGQSSLLDGNPCADRWDMRVNH